MEEVCDLLWPDKVYDQRVKRLYRKAVSCLHKTLGLYCPSPVFENLRGKCHVIPDAFQCDYYAYLRGPADAPPPDITYMRQYDWAEETCARLYFAALRHGSPPE